MRVVVFLDSIDELIGRVIVVWTLIMSNEVRVVVFLDSIDEWTAESQCFFLPFSNHCRKKFIYCTVCIYQYELDSDFETK